MKKFFLILLLLCFAYTLQAQNITPITANFEWQLFEDIIKYDPSDKNKFKLYKSDFSTKSDYYLEGVFKGYYDKGWITKQGNEYIFNAPKQFIWLVDTSTIGDDIVYLTDDDDMINNRVWPYVYDRETGEILTPDIVEYIQVKFPSKEKVKAQAVKRFPSDDTIRSSCSKATYLSKEKEKEKIEIKKIEIKKIGIKK